MEIKLYSKSRLLNEAFTGLSRQVYVSTKGKNDFIDKAAAGSVTAVVSPDLSGQADHIFALNIHRDFEGNAEVILVKNTSDTQGEYALRAFDFDDLKHFLTIEQNPSHDDRN